ncbi:prokaryotic diacylglycerol kinase family protein [Latilactobacillus graminis DSM 20719]|uniref:Prokaryotic diacylglycerol kinase family protein n=1 Tax=Latilactobacillus graminis DSM 20719 TaxID=1423752 RepID=A0AA89KWZ8_9LACO|nr:prokaryotic diacylglycerol kinase family protein [Latilactobacillus graminis DSM 20719]
MDYNGKKPQTSKNKYFWQSLRHAIAGLFAAFKTEANLRRDIWLALIVVGLGIYYQLTYLEWLAIILAIFIVLMAEFWNTVIEYLVDLLVDHQFHPLAKQIKDISAASVLISAILALLIGIIVFGHAIFN